MKTKFDIDPKFKPTSALIKHFLVIRIWRVCVSVCFFWALFTTKLFSTLIYEFPLVNWCQIEITRNNSADNRAIYTRKNKTRLK